MKKLLCIVLLLLAHINLFAQREGLQMPSLSYYDDGEKSALRLTELHINVKVVGNLATTTMDMLFYNDTKMTLEGELNFPLAEGQQICHFAMELNGKLRDAVVVEKAEGRKVFEEITRRKIDPALLEQTKGNSFRTRVYPILGQQTKRVVIAYENEMLLDDDGMTYNLPLQYKDELEKFSLKVQVFTPQKPDLKNSEFQDLNFEQDENYFAAEVHYEDYLADKNFEFFLPNSVFEKQIYTELISGKT
ncbi:MAG TPA: VIT domain-containing protein, partial [Candidatus Kapabacteria bacterium]|nr:VIT domain-containing protein [Candidatus Kapabacteria bacterium]